MIQVKWIDRNFHGLTPQQKSNLSILQTQLTGQKEDQMVEEISTRLVGFYGISTIEVYFI